MDLLATMDALVPSIREGTGKIGKMSKLNKRPTSLDEYWETIQHLSRMDSLYEVNLMSIQRDFRTELEEQYAYSLPTSERIAFLKPY
jgi:hypothetical protein